MVLLDVLPKGDIPLDLWSYLVQQVPVVVVLGVFCWFLYKLILKRDAVIKDKDDLLEKERGQVMELYGKAIEAQNKTTDALNKLIELIKDTRDDVDYLRELIHQQKQ